MNTEVEQIELPNYASLKIAIWLYFLLWIFEGALRKWVLPSLATPLLIVRDPIAIYIILRAIYLNVKFANGYIVAALIFTLMSLAITLTFGHGNLFVGLYGARIMLLHFPLIFIIGAVFTKEDVLQMGRALLVINIIVSLIVYFQFSSPQTAFINIGIGGEGSSGFSGAMGYSRPSGTFSFTTGLSVFYAAVSVFVFYFWLSKEQCSKILLYVSTITMVVILPLTISRGAVVGVVVVGLFGVMAAVTSGKMLFKLFIAGFAFYLVILALQTYTTIFNLGTAVFMDRVESANKFSGGGIEESILMRAVNDFIGPIFEILNQPMFAGNLGMGTNAGAQMLTGKISFLVAESEFGRVGGEQGIIFGGGIIALRILLSFSNIIKSWKLPQEKKLLPFILCGSASIAVFQGQWAQPSILGYAVIMVGLVMASLKNENATLQKENS
jgi:hypothetical protein